MDDKVRDIIKKVKSTATAAGYAAGKTAEAAGKRASEMVEVTKLNLQIFDLNTEISVLYKEIGEIVYRAHRGEDTEDLGLEGRLSVIDEKFAEIDVMKGRMENLKRTKKCSSPECGKVCSKDDRFCSHCGTAIE